MVIMKNTQMSIIISIIFNIISGVKNYLEEWDGHSENHPYVDHLDVGSDRQGLRETKKTSKISLKLTGVLI